MGRKKNKKNKTQNFGRKFEDKMNLRAIWQRIDNNVFVYGHIH